MKCNHVKARYLDFLKQEMDLTERQAIETHLAGCGDCRLELQEIEAAWTGLDYLPECMPSSRLRERFYASLNNAIVANTSGVVRKPAWPFLFQPQWAVAFSLVILLCGFAIGRFYPAGGTTDSATTDASQLSQIQKEVSELRGLMALSLLSQDSVQARLRGIEYARESGSGDPQVLGLLLNTIDRDETSNVRLAALDALDSHLDNSMVRERIYERLLMEPSPLVQLKIVKMLLEGADNDGHKLLDDLLKTGILDPAVAGYLRQTETGSAGTDPGKLL